MNFCYKHKFKKVSKKSRDVLVETMVEFAKTNRPPILHQMTSTDLIIKKSRDVLAKTNRSPILQSNDQYRLDRRESIQKIW